MPGAISGEHVLGLEAAVAQVSVRLSAASSSEVVTWLSGCSPSNVRVLPASVPNLIRWVVRGVGQVGVGAQHPRSDWVRSDDALRHGDAAASHFRSGYSSVSAAAWNWGNRSPDRRAQFWACR